MKAKEYRDKFIETMKSSGDDLGSAVTDASVKMCEEARALILSRNVKQMGGIQGAILEIHQKWISFAQADKRIPADFFLDKGSDDPQCGRF